MAEAAAKLETASRKLCVVACKVPNGLILRLFKMIDTTEAVQGGPPRKVPVAQQIGEQVKINGPAAPHGMSPRCEVANGYALTYNVDAEFMAAWLKQNHDLDAVRNKMILAHDQPESVRDETRDNVGRRSGLERLQVPLPEAPDLTLDPRIEQSASPSVSRITTAAEQPKAAAA